MEKVWGATMKLTDEVMGMRKAMEQMQTNIFEKNNEIPQLHSSISNERLKVLAKVNL